MELLVVGPLLRCTPTCVCPVHWDARRALPTVIGACLHWDARRALPTVAKLHAVTVEVQ